MGIFDDGYQQNIIDAERNPFERLPAGFLETFSERAGCSSAALPERPPDVSAVVGK